MLKVPNIVLPSDFSHLSKDSLHAICAELEIPNDGTVNDLSNRVWDKIKDSNELQNVALYQHSNKLLCGKTAITWYRLTSGSTLKGAKELIISALGVNPFEVRRIPTKEKLTTDPILIGAAPGNEPYEYYLRFMYKSGVTTHYFGAEKLVTPISTLVTVYINESTGCIEVRADSKKAGLIINKLASLIEQNITVEQRKIMAPYGNNIELIVDKLGGKFIDAVSKPELLLGDLTSDQADAVLKMLKAIDTFFEDEDNDVLTQELDDARSALGADAAEIPFTSLVLAGLEKVGLGVSGKDLRCNQLYNYLNEHMQHQGGYIQFACKENHVAQEYTIRVGRTTNSVFFTTPATENAIKYVRENVIMNMDEN